MNIEWMFPKNEGGQESGFHDPGVETFKGNFDRHLAREAIQNSLDARDDVKKPVKVEFSLAQLSPERIPDMASLSRTFSLCADYWTSDRPAKDFFSKAASLAKAGKIPSLRIGDYNTTGVLGSDSDRTRNWYNLIRCSGSSSKWGGEGGSFGIGKNAPFAASRLRTVLYSTKNKDDELIFQGVAKLVSHARARGGIAQPTGYLGGPGGASIRRKGDIPADFIRKDFGTDIWVLGFRADATWRDDLVYSVLENFWPAIHFGDLSVRVDGMEISQKTLGSLLDHFSAKPEFSAHLYYQAFVNPTLKAQERLPTLRECSVHLLAGAADLPKRIAMVRKTGMVVYHKRFHSLVPFSGVFICRNDQGNGMLREMEPPRHDIWDPDHPEKGANKALEREFLGHLRECIARLSPKDDAKIVAIPELSRFLPDDEDGEEEEFSESGRRAEGFNRKPDVQKLQGRKIDSRRRDMQPDESKPEKEDQETEEFGDGEGTGGGGSGRPNEADGGTGAGGGKGSGGSAGTLGSEGGIHSKPAIPIRYRSYVKNAEAGVYVLAAFAIQPHEQDACLIVRTVGDDRKAPAEILDVRTPEGNPVPTAGPGAIGPVRFPKKGSLLLELTLKEPVLVAMEVSAHEA